MTIIQIKLKYSRFNNYKIFIQLKEYREFKIYILKKLRNNNCIRENIVKNRKI